MAPTAYCPTCKKALVVRWCNQDGWVAEACEEHRAVAFSGGVTMRYT